MERGELHAAVARAAAYADWQVPTEITIPVGARHDRIAAAAIRVVLAEAERSIVPLVADYICDKAATCDECLDTARGWIAEALAALVTPPPV